MRKSVVSEDSADQRSITSVDTHKSARAAYLIDGQKRFLLYNFEDSASFIFTLLAGFQGFIVSAMTYNVVFSLINKFMCPPDITTMMQYTSSTFLFSGFAMLVDNFIGSRLPVVLGPLLGEMGGNNQVVLAEAESLDGPFNATPCDTLRLNPTLHHIAESRFRHRMNIWQGVVISIGIMRFIWGVLGLVGLLQKAFSPLVLSLLLIIHSAKTSSEIGKMTDGSNTYFMFMFIGVLGFVAFILGHFHIPVMVPHPKEGFRVRRVRIFYMFSILITTSLGYLTWNVGGWIVPTDTVTQAGDIIGPPADDSKDIPTISFPVPGAFGSPIFPGMRSMWKLFLNSISNCIESTFSLNLAASYMGIPNPPADAINRSAVVYNLIAAISGLFGCIGAIGAYKISGPVVTLTGLGARRFGFAVGVLTMLSGCSPKIIYFLTSIPFPLLTAIFCVTLILNLSQALYYFYFLDMNSLRNRSIIGITVAISMALPEMLLNKTQKAYLTTGQWFLDDLTFHILTSPSDLSVLLAIILDNTVPGTDEERGLQMWKVKSSSGETMEELVHSSPYALPVGVSFILKNFSWTSQSPVCPVYNSDTSFLDIIMACFRGCSMNFGRMRGKGLAKGVDVEVAEKINIGA